MINDLNSNLQENTAENQLLAKIRRNQPTAELKSKNWNLSRDRKFSFQQIQVTTSTNLALKKKLKREKVKS